MRSGFGRRSIPCLSGLFALDVCASIHLYASNASAPLHSVFFHAIRVRTIPNGCDQGLIGFEKTMIRVWNYGSKFSGLGLGLGLGLYYCPRNNVRYP